MSLLLLEFSSSYIYVYSSKVLFDKNQLFFELSLPFLRKTSNHRHLVLFSFYFMYISFVVASLAAFGLFFILLLNFLHYTETLIL